MHAMLEISLKWFVYFWTAFAICKAEQKVHNCAEVQTGGATRSGIYTVHLNDQPTEVYCDLSTAGGGWTVLQRRKDGSEDFFRTWMQYKIGFGHLSSEFWLGNENIHQMTDNSKLLLRVDMTAYDGTSRYAEYANFSLSKEETGYKLQLGNYFETSNAGDSLTYHRDMPFATWDRDNKVECASRRHGAWWYNNCLKSNLNALHDQASKWSNVVWQEWRGPESLLSTEMKIRPMHFETGPLHCSDIQDGDATGSGVYAIRAGSRRIKVFCDLTTTDGGWTVLQRRFSGSSNFMKTWDEYRHGFGDVFNEFWLGNDNIHAITSSGGRFLLRIELISHDGDKRIAEYSDFSLDTAENDYKLHLGKYVSRSDAGDSLSYHRDMSFSTWDRDNSPRKCALKQRGGWWFNKCFHSNLNGLQEEGEDWSGIIWTTWRGYQPLKAAEMKIKQITSETEALLKVPNVRCPSGSLRDTATTKDAIPAIATDCADLQTQGTKTATNTISVAGQPVAVRCDFNTDGGGWTVIQERMNPGQYDNKTKWIDYKNGFVISPSDLWLGSENVHRITAYGNKYILRIELTSFSGQRRIAEYDKFYLDSEDENYRIKFGSYLERSDAGDALSFHRNMPFSTYDRDNTRSKCTRRHHGGWWYSECVLANLNGMYSAGSGWSFILWTTWEGSQSLKSTKMMMRPADFRRSASDCSEIQWCGIRQSGIYTVYPEGHATTVNCDLTTDGGGWTVLQNRRNGSVDFNKTWAEYAAGFGTTSGEFWLGNDNINFITTNQMFLLRIELETFDGIRRIAEYGDFSLGDSSTHYVLHIGDYHSRSDAGDALTYHRNMPFSTWDSDTTVAHCASRGYGGWWYNRCQRSNLNGQYGDTDDWRNAIWDTLKGTRHLKTMQMKIRPMEYIPGRP